MIEILVVEDEFIVADDLASILETSGYRVLGTTDSGEAGIDLAKKLRPQIVLMDVFLRGRLTGIEAAERIQRTLKIPVVFLTGQATLRNLNSIKKLNPCGFIMKPFNVDELIACLQNVARHYGIE